MTLPAATPTMMMVPLRERTVALLMAHRLAPDDTLDRVVERLAIRKSGIPEQVIKQEPANAPAESAFAGGTHRVIVLGTQLTASTLGRLFAEVVDAIHDLDPAVIERLAIRRARTRRFVSPNKTGVHAGRSDLRVVQTRSGWWVSGNVGKADVRRGLKALCKVASITFGEDIAFPVRAESTDRAP
jgi:hypothetical protein